MPELTDETRVALVRAIHATPGQFVLVVTGGGMAAVTDLLLVPGASRSVLEVVVPYAEASLVELVGGSLPGGAVSEATARAMAQAAAVRAGRLAPDHHPVFGFACTAALVTDRDRKGEHRAHLAAASPAGSASGAGPDTAGADPSGPGQVHHQRVTLAKGAQDRAGEDRTVADALLTLIAATCGVG